MTATTETSPQTVNARHVLGLLADRHTNDVFVPECKDGPSQASSHIRLDAWAMARSWSNPATYGYEIKVSRSDFMQDKKAHLYLECCNNFYFVCPYGLIQPEEIFAEAGLIWVAKTGTRLWVKKKAPYRKIEHPETLWRYILMARASITPSNFNEMAESREQWLKRKEENLAYGHSWGRRLATRIETEITRVAKENKELLARIEKLEPVEDMLKRMDINPRAWSPERETREQLKRLNQSIDPRFVEQMTRTTRECQALLDRLKEIEDRNSNQQQQERRVG